MDYNSQLIDRLEKELYVIFLAYVANYSNEQIAKTMGLGSSRVSQIKKKGLVRIKHLYRRYNCEKSQEK